MLWMHWRTYIVTSSSVFSESFKEKGMFQTLDNRSITNLDFEEFFIYLTLINWEYTDVCLSGLTFLSWILKNPWKTKQNRIQVEISSFHRWGYCQTSDVCLLFPLEKGAFKSQQYTNAFLELSVYPRHMVLCAFKKKKKNSLYLFSWVSTEIKSFWKTPTRSTRTTWVPSSPSP